MPDLKILFITSEIFPLIKTGGLADVSAGLPPALSKLGAETRILLPAYLPAVQKMKSLKTLDTPRLAHDATILEGKLPGTKLTIWLVDIPKYFTRIGNPYTTEEGNDWPDNAQRFTAFNQIALEISQNRANLDWPPDIVHCNDWQTGLIPALLAKEVTRPATIFTIHNLAYMGLFSWNTFEELGLPHDLWDMDKMEFHGQFAFIKGGLSAADHITTVSPTYAQEVQTSEFGYGLEGLLQARSHQMSGILNGIDHTLWNPATDKLIDHNYSKTKLSSKLKNKTSLQTHFALPPKKAIPLLVTVGRIVEQKGYDLLIKALPELMLMDIQIALLGSGDKYLETQLIAAAQEHPEKLSVRIGYDEVLAHKMEAGADVFLMPSKFEPCGLNQLYSLKYGTIPIVNPVGGLADSIIDIKPNPAKATGIYLTQSSPEALIQAVETTVNLFHNPPQWQKLIKTAMSQDFSWKNSAKQYLTLYKTVLKNRQSTANK